jgi:hypothetical protein
VRPALHGTREGSSRETEPRIVRCGNPVSLQATGGCQWLSDTGEERLRVPSFVNSFFSCLLATLGANRPLPLQKENSDVRNFQLADTYKRPVSPQSGQEAFFGPFPQQNLPLFVKSLIVFIRLSLRSLSLINVRGVLW